jgi:hypothetical protein
VRRLRRTASRWEDEEWQGKFRAWLRDLGITRAAALCISPLSEVPAVIGHLKPVVLLPAAIIARLTPSQLEAVILHELMHVRRNDYLANLLQHLCETILFFNPFVWWISRAIRIEREHCCDDLVTSRSGDKLGYAKALTRIEELRGSPEGALVLAASGGSLKRRISRILGVEKVRSAPSAWSSAVCAVLIIGTVFTLALPRSIAQTDNKGSLEVYRVVPDGTPEAEIVHYSHENITFRLSIVKPAILNASHVARVRLLFDPLSSKPQVMVFLDDTGKEVLAKFSRENIGKQVAILVGGKVVSAPVLNGPLSGTEFAVGGELTRDAAIEIGEQIDPNSKPELEAWVPPKDLSAIRTEGQHDENDGRYKEALEKYVSYFTASRYDAAQGAVRLSFALSDWLRLGQKYPPALDKMKEMRDSTGETLRSSEKTADYFTGFQEYAAFNKTLRDEEKTADMFVWFDQHDPETARKLFLLAEPALIKARLYKVCGKYISPESFESIRDDYERLNGIFAKNGKMDAATRKRGEAYQSKRFRNSTATLIALLVLNDQKPAAEKIAKEAVAVSDDTELKTLIDAALQGKVPEPWP